MKPVLDALIGHAAAELLYALHCAGVIDELATPHSAAEVAAARGLDPATTSVALELVARETGVLHVRGDRFVLSPAAAGDGRWRALLEKFLGAYGEIVRRPLAHLRVADRAGAPIDEAALTRAYAGDGESALVVDAIASLDARGVLDLGCGSGGLLERVCRRRGVRGWGLDRSASMCHAARARLAAAGLARRVTVRRGSALDAARLLSPAERRRVDVLHAASLLNEWMADDAIAVAALARLAAGFPGRTLVVVDYLGALGRGRRGGPYTHLTDLSQALSGQGVPPSSHAAWSRLYHAAGATLLRAAESRTFDLRWFMHVVRLPDTGAPAPRAPRRRVSPSR